MPSFTVNLADKAYLLPDSITLTEHGYCGEAVDKLARLEQYAGWLADEQRRLSEELEQLRREGKTNTVKFRERLQKKLQNGVVLSAFSLYALD